MCMRAWPCFVARDSRSDLEAIDREHMGARGMHVKASLGAHELTMHAYAHGYLDT